jgi:hypothetical protein
MPQIQGPLPTLLHSTQPISLKVAQNWLSSYSTHAESSPHLHPNSTFTPERLEFSSHGPEGGITMHLLRRIEKGLGGEVLEPLKEELEGDDRVLDSQISPTATAATTAKEEFGGGKRKHADLTTDADWQDPEKFALEQGEDDDVGEIGDRHNFVQEVSEEPEVHADAEDEVEGLKPVSKEDRKAAKKAKRQAEKREKNEKNKKQKMNHGSDEEYI